MRTLVSSREETSMLRRNNVKSSLQLFYSSFSRWKSFVDFHAPHSLCKLALTHQDTASLERSNPILLKANGCYLLWPQRWLQSCLAKTECSFWNTSAGWKKNKDSDPLTSQSVFNIICLHKNQLLKSDFPKFILKDPFNLAICWIYLNKNERNVS